MGTQVLLSYTVLCIRKVKACELMISDALCAVSEQLGIAEKVLDPAQYITLDDHIERMCFTMDPDDPGVAQAREIMRQMDMRKLYKFANEIVVPRTPVYSAWEPPTPAEISTSQNSDGLVSGQPTSQRAFQILPCVTTDPLVITLITCE